MISGWVAPLPAPPPSSDALSQSYRSHQLKQRHRAAPAPPSPDVSASSCYSFGFVFVFFHLCVFGVKLELLCFFFSCVLRRPASAVVMQVFIHRSTFVQSGATYKWVSAFTCTATSALDSGFSSSVLLTAAKRLQVV